MGIETALIIAAVAVSAAGGAYSAISSSQAAAVNAENQARQADYESAQNAENAKAATSREQEVTRRILASHAPSYAKAGVALLGPEDSSSEFEVLMSEARDRALVEADSAYGYTLRSKEAAAQAPLYRNSARSLREQGFAQAGISLLGGATSIGGAYYGRQPRRVSGDAIVGA